MKKRICMLTSRGILHNAFRCGFFEAQDILQEIDDVKFIELVPKFGYRTRQAFQNYLISRDFTNKIISWNLSIQSEQLKEEYELFIAYLPVWTDLTQISAVKNWKEKCKVSICWIDELWASGVSKLGSYLSVLEDFDHVILGLQGTVDVLNQAIKRQCHWIPHGVDTMRFNPFVNPVKRVIDIFSMGRIYPEMHEKLIEFSRENKLFYIYDTFHASDTRIMDYKKHREMIADMIKRSLFFTVSAAKMDIGHESKNQSEIGARYFEGTAAGAVLIGQIPGCDSFRKLFGWNDSVVEINKDGSDLKYIMQELYSDKSRIEKIRDRNSKEALLRHDWVYRWEKVLEIAGMKPTPKLLERKEMLSKIAKK